MRAHIIKDGLVVDTIEVDSLDFMLGLIDGTIGGKGWRFVDGELFAPDAELPSIEENNSMILAQLEANDLKSIRAIREGDIERINAWNEQQNALRAKLMKD